MTLDKPVALVTGSSRGIGAAVARALAADGAHVAVTWLGDADASDARDVGDAIEAAGGTAELVQGDVSDAKSVEAMIGQVERAHGRLDILVNNAGFTKDAPVAGLREADFRRVLDVNLGGTFLCTKRALRSMLPARRGRIVNVASIQGIRGGRGQANYAAAKAGVLAFTRATALEVAGHGIRVNAVLPGFIDTAMTAVLKRRAGDEILKHVPVGRFGTPEDVAGVVRFLCSEAADYVTGQGFVVDGGLSIA